MRSIALRLIIALLCCAGQAQAQDWIQRQGGIGNDATTDLASSQEESTVATGYFTGAADFSANNTLASSGLTDIFIVRYSSNGDVIWSKKAGGTSSDRGLSIAGDASGNIYVTGFYSGTAQFDGQSISANGSGQDIFLAKYAQNGDLEWVQSAGGSENSDIGYSIAVSSDGNVLVSGQFTGSASFGPNTINATGTGNNAFVASYDSNGNNLWARAIQSDATCRALACDFDPSGNALVTGQVTGNLTLDNTYSNNSQNAVFVAQLDNSGAENWVKLAVGGGLGISYDLETDNAGAVFIVGAYENDMSFLGPPTETISGNYSNSAFIAKYGSDGSFDWGQSLSSENAVTGRGISLTSNEILITGEFDCVYSDLADEYGSGIFNSVGFQDVFLAGFSLSGDFQYARHFASHQEDASADVAHSGTGIISFGGTFSGHLVVPSDNAVDGNDIEQIGGEGPNFNVTFCDDPNYGVFSSIDAAGGSEGFVIQGLNLDREPLDYWARSGSGCDRSRPDFCIGTGSIDNECGPDTLEFCSNSTISAVSLTAADVDGIGEVGPNWSYLWNTGATSRSITVSSEGTYSVDFTSEDGCITGSADVYVEFLPVPDPPVLSDNQGINDEANPTQPIILCEPVDIDLTGGNFGDNSYEWFGPGLTGVEEEMIDADESGTYTFSVTNEEGCSNSVSVGVVIQEAEPPDPIDPGILFVAEEMDTVSVCSGESLSAEAIDLITYPEGLENSQVSWTYETPTGSGSLFSFILDIMVGEEGWYSATADITLFPENECGGDTLYYEVTDSVFVEAFPVPDSDVEISPDVDVICPGDSINLTATSNGSVEWLFDNNFYASGPSITVTESGTYTATVSITNEFGCTANSTDNVTLTDPELPEIFSQPEIAVICPNDSVLLQSTPGENYQWVGPGGPVGANSDEIYVTEAGQYFCEVDVGDGCVLVTNTIEVTQYSTPQLTAEGPPILCPGETITISANVSNNAEVEWLAPLSGSEPEQVIDEPGTYSALVTACDITTEVSIDVELSGIELDVNTIGPAEPCAYDSVLLVAGGVADSFSWQPGDIQTDSLWVFEPGEFFVTASDTNGCELEEGPFNIQFADPVEASPIEQLVCEGDPFEYSPSGQEQFTWFSDSEVTDTIAEGTLQTSPLFSDTTYHFITIINGCLSEPAEAQVDVQPPPPAPELGSNAPVCLGENLTLSAEADGATNYSWTFPNGSNFSGGELGFFADDLNTFEGQYSCVASINGCEGDASQLTVDLFIPVPVSLHPDTTICQGDQLILEPGDEFSQLVWNGTDTSNTWLVQEGGEVSVLARDLNGCETTAEGSYEVLECDITVPNVMTPNDDDRNDEFVVFAEAATFLTLEIYNRWGRMIYRSEEVPAIWDGRNMRSDELVPDGTYFYILQGRRFDGSPINSHGDVTVIRD